MLTLANKLSYIHSGPLGQHEQLIYLYFRQITRTEASRFERVKMNTTLVTVVIAVVLVGSQEGVMYK